ncbi:MAG: FtsX-like permease family protein [Thermodesulfobacteriota bacterium]|nr:FtsX-like permease family protein [Thermodesulfobacteriota bacterium]
MILYLKLAWRNIWRNSRRTMITQFALIVALALMIACSGLTWGLVKQMERNATLLGPGEIQIHHPGYLDDKSIYRVINSPHTLIATIEKLGVKASPRLHSFGLVSSGENSSGAQILGIDPSGEKRVTEFHNHLFKGSFIKNANDVLLGRKIALTLDVSIGDELLIVTQAADGSIGNDLYRVAGILRGIGEEIDRSTVMMSLSDFRNLFSLSDVATEIVIRRVDEDYDLSALRDRIQQAVPTEEVKTWREMFPAVSDMLELTDVSIYILLAIIYIAGSLIMLNTMLMSVFERIKELGIMMAIGFRPLQVLILIFLETFLITLCGSLIGLLLGVGLSLYLTYYGLDLTSITEGFSFVGIMAEPHWFAVTNFTTVYPPFIFLFVFSLIAVIYPAIKVSLLKPVDALVFN